MDNREKVTKLFELAGGIGNVKSVTHCATRLRFFVIDKKAVNTEEIKKVEGVLGVVFVNDELQMVFGKNVIPVYNEASTMFNEKSGGAKGNGPAVKEKLTFKKAGNAVIGFVSASVTPLIPGLLAGGMMKVFLLLATLAFPSFADATAYTLLSQVADIPFYFMPIFVAYGAAKKLGGTPLYAMAVAGALMYPNFMSLLSDAAEAGTQLTIFCIPITNVSYKSTLLPALLIGLFAYYVEKFLTRIIPGILKNVLVGMLTIGITYVAAITILGPLGDIVGSYIVNVFLFASAHFGPVAIAILAACMPWLVMTGMHHAVTPFMVQAFADPGYDVFFRPSYILHNMSEGGACIGVALRTKNKEFRVECLSLAFGCIVAGVTEPALYGVNFRLKKPMIGIMAGGAVGGVVAGLFHVCAYSYGYSTILALPIFVDTAIYMAIAIVVAIIVSALVTFILGFEDVPSDKAPAKKAATEEAAAAIEETQAADTAAKEAAAPISGTVVAQENIPDETFAAGILGAGIGINSEEEVVSAPFDGVIETVAETGHAVGITSGSGMELLIHVGVDTVKMNGEGFEPLVKEGDRVTKGQPLLKFSKEKIKAAGYPDTVVVLVTNSEDLEGLQITKEESVSAGDVIFTA